MPELVVMDMAREWQTPPWVIWEQCSQKWWDLRAAIQAEKNLQAQHNNAEPETIGSLNPNG